MTEQPIKIECPFCYNRIDIGKIASILVIEPDTAIEGHGWEWREGPYGGQAPMCPECQQDPRTPKMVRIPDAAWLNE